MTINSSEDGDSQNSISIAPSPEHLKYDTPAARKYADIINMPRPMMHHQRMDPLNRAKIFAPFDALRGFDEEIEKVDKIRSVDRSEVYTDADFPS